MSAGAHDQRPPILLYNGECAVCRSIAGWVGRSSRPGLGAAGIVETPIGDDPQALDALRPGLDIWDAYETIHLIMPDGSMKLGGEAVAEVLRRLPNCRWFAWTFAVRILGARPFQTGLDLAYAILADARPLLGCESCGIPSPWVKFTAAVVSALRGQPQRRRDPAASPHYTATTRA